MRMKRICIDGCTGTLRASSQGTPPHTASPLQLSLTVCSWCTGECVRVHRYTISRQAGNWCGVWPGRRMRRAHARPCTSTPVHYEQAVREENAASVCGCTGTLRASSQGGECGECVWVHRYTMSNQSGKRMRRVCAGTPVHYERTAREEDAASVCGYTGTLQASSQEGECGECVQVHRYTMSKQSGRGMWRVCAGTPVHYEQTVREEYAASVCGYTGTL